MFEPGERITDQSTILLQRDVRSSWIPRRNIQSDCRIQRWSYPDGYCEALKSGIDVEGYEDG